jgi:hypothetical protein
MDVDHTPIATASDKVVRVNLAAVTAASGQCLFHRFITTRASSAGE